MGKAGSLPIRLRIEAAFSFRNQPETSDLLLGSRIGHEERAFIDIYV
jgi:hypothetical protein